MNRMPEGYDALVIATGATARIPEGAAGITGVHTLRTRDVAAAVRTALAAGARTVVIGAGFIGSEVASSARSHGVTTTIAEAAPVPLIRAVGERLGIALTGLHHRNGTDLRCGVAVTAFETVHGRIAAVELSDGSTIDADLVVAGIGADPATGWLTGSRVAVDNGVRATSTLQALDVDGTPIDGVYAAGDVVNWHNSLFERSMRIEHWTNAAEQGAAAARNALAPQEARPYETIPYFWSDWYGRRIQFVGVAGADEVRLVSGDLEDDRFVVLYRTGDRLTGVLTLNGQRVIMKYRGLLTRRTAWEDALAFAADLERRVANA